MTPRMAVTKFLIAAVIAVMGFALIGLTFDKTTVALSAAVNQVYLSSSTCGIRNAQGSHRCQ